MFRLLSVVTIVFLLSSSCNSSPSLSIFMLTDIDQTYSGTGFELNYKGQKYTITNAHICNNNKVLVARLTNPNRPKLLIVKRIYKDHDLCVLYPVDSAPGFELANDWNTGEKASVEGFPFGVHGYSTGTVGKFLPAMGNIFVVYRGIIHPGNSGSPVLNKDGKVIGVIAIGSSTQPELGGFVPLEFIKDLLDNLNKQDYNINIINGGTNVKED